MVLTLIMLLKFITFLIYNFYYVYLKQLLKVYRNKFNDLHCDDATGTTDTGRLR